MPSASPSLSSRPTAPIVGVGNTYQHTTIGGVDLEPEDRVFFLIGSANRDEAVFHDLQLEVSIPMEG